jgi:hypothetical protein
MTSPGQHPEAGAGRRAATGIKECELCGRRFGCLHGQPGCWCEGVTLAAGTLIMLHMIATDCVCPACLSGLAGPGGTGGAGP